jgi:hypothetical protein
MSRDLSALRPAGVSYSVRISEKCSISENCSEVVIWNETIVQTIYLRVKSFSSGSNSGFGFKTGSPGSSLSYVSFYFQNANDIVLKSPFNPVKLHRVKQRRERQTKRRMEYI